MSVYDRLGYGMGEIIRRHRQRPRPAPTDRQVIRQILWEQAQRFSDAGKDYDPREQDPEWFPPGTLFAAWRDLLDAAWPPTLRRWQRRTGFDFHPAQGTDAATETREATDG